MEATTPGQNRTGAAMIPKEINLMLEAVRDLSPPSAISTLQIDAERLSYISHADSVGSIPPPASKTKGRSKKGIAKLGGVSPNIFLDKLGERIAFERTGTRLYDALISKYLALSDADGDVLPPADSILQAEPAQPSMQIAATGDETAVETLRRIRGEELGHFRMLCDAMSQLGGDPTAQTPCADVTAAASMGLMQVITDPRTTLAQCLNTILMAELTDNAGWELLSQLAKEANQGDLAEQFSRALEAEQGHLIIINGWLKALVLNESGTAAI
jgi:rubrerythrin